MGRYYDELEYRDPRARREARAVALPALIAAAKAKAPGWRAHLADVKPDEITSPEALAGLPILRKSALPEMQAADPPFGGLATQDPHAFERVLMSPGPIFEPEVLRPDYWRTARAFFAAGFRKGDLVHNCFAYNLSPGAFIMEAGARALGCPVIPAGVGNTELQIEAIAHYRPTGFTGTPDYLKALLDAAGEMGKDCSSITKALVSGGALFPAMRNEYAERGITCLQCYAIADIGLIAYESSAMDGMIVDEGVIVEIVRPGTGDPVPDGEVGEVVVTAFNPDYPMIRLATGDLSAVMSGASPCGRTNLRIKGWLGRADQAAKVRGVFVRPEQIAEIAKRHPELARLRLELTRKEDQDSMTLKAESDQDGDGLAEAVAATVRAVTKVKGQVEIVPRESLPNDGLVIADLRDYD